MRALLVVLALSLSACINVSWGDGERVEGSGTVGTRTVDVAGVRAVHLATPGTLLIERGAAPLEMEGDDNILARIEAEVRGGTLVIEAADGYELRPQADLRFRVGVGRLEGVRVAGGGHVEARRAEAETVRVEVAGSGSVEMTDVRAEAVRVSVAGSGDVTLAGRTGALGIEIAGSGDVDASGLQSDAAEVEIAGSGGVTLRAEKTLDVRVTGSGDIRYYGSPEVTRSIAGSGDVSRVDG